MYKNHLVSGQKSNLLYSHMQTRSMYTNGPNGSPFSDNSRPQSQEFGTENRVELR
jgi:hypothetical protein